MNSTAALLGAYRRELAEEGFDAIEIQGLVAAAARALLDEGPLVVRKESTSREGSLDCCYKRANHRHD